MIKTTWDWARAARVLVSAALLGLSCSDSGRDGATGDDAGAGAAIDGGASGVGGAAATSGTGVASDSGGRSSSASGGGGDDASQLGTGGSGSDASTPDSGTTPDGGQPGAPDSPACMPQTTAFTSLEMNARDATCFVLPEQSGIANPDEATVYDLPLDGPLAAGQMHAVNLSPPKSLTPGAIEIWGASEACMPRELLWVGKMEGRRQCAQFTPTQEHRRLLFVDHMLDVLRGVYSRGPYDVAICAGGTCSSTPDGEGLRAGVTLTPIAGVYQTMNSESFPAGRQWEVGRSGRIMVVHAGPTAEPRPLHAAAFRMPAGDPFGDGWYCAGAGSQVAKGELSSTHYISLAGLSRLPACSASGSGTLTLSWNHAMRNGTLTSSIAEFNGSDLSLAGRCVQERCMIEIVTPDQTRSMHLFVHANGDFGTQSAPNTTEHPLREAIVFSVPTQRTPLAYACTTSGTARSDRNGTTTVTLQGLSALAPCSGTAVTPAMTKITIK